MTGKYGLLGGERKTVKLKNGETVLVIWPAVLFLAVVLLLMGMPIGSLKQGIIRDITNSLYGLYLPMAIHDSQDAVRQPLPIMKYAKYNGTDRVKGEAEHTSRIEIPSEWEEVPGDSLMEELMREENQAAVKKEEKEQVVSEEEEKLVREGAFTPHKKQMELNWKNLSSYEELLKQFYTVDANTMAGSDQLDAVRLSEKDLRIDRQVSGPQILIYHTHSQESFADSVPGDSSTSIVGVGEQLSRILTEQYGYEVLHHTGEYDKKTRDDAYANALPAIEQLLEENPSIQVVIDLHRDEMPEETRLVMNLDNRPTARFMFFNGLSRTRKTGNLDYLKNDYQEDNLAFSFQMKQKAEEYYPGLTRKIYLKGYRYNMHLCPRTLLIELGAQNNTVEEAMNACDPLAHLLDMVLSGT